MVSQKMTIFTNSFFILTIVISTVCLKYPKEQLDIIGFENDSERYEKVSATEFDNEDNIYAIYSFLPRENLTLTCKSNCKNTYWTYEETTKLAHFIVKGQKVQISFYPEDDRKLLHCVCAQPETSMTKTIQFLKYQQRTDKGCHLYKNGFYITSLQEEYSNLNWSESKYSRNFTCNTTLRYSEKTTLNLVCHRNIAKKIKNHYNLMWKFDGKIEESVPVRSSATVTLKKTIDERDNGAILLCETSYKVATLKTYKISFKLNYIRKITDIQLTTSPTTAPIPSATPTIKPNTPNHDSTSNGQHPYLLPSRQRRSHKNSSILNNQNSVNATNTYEIINIQVQLEVVRGSGGNKIYNYICKSPEGSNVILTEGNKVKIIVNSSKRIVRSFCFVRGDNEINHLLKCNEINDMVYEKELNISRAMNGAWNFTFLGYRNSYEYGSNWHPKYVFDDQYYLRANCVINITVKQPPTTPMPLTTNTKPVPSRITSRKTSRTTSRTTTRTTPKMSTSTSAKIGSYVKPITIKSETTTVPSKTENLTSFSTDKNNIYSTKSPFQTTTPQSDDDDPLASRSKGYKIWKDMRVWYAVAGVACFVLLIIVICVLRSHAKRNKEAEKHDSDVTYENLSNEPQHQFPPNLQNTYADPHDLKPSESNYSVPHVDVYAKLVPKSQRKELLYSKVVPKSQRQKPEDPYAEILPNSQDPKQLTYAEIPVQGAGSNVVKNIEPTYSEIRQENYANLRGYTNEHLFNEKGRYANMTDIEYIEPAYCELNRK